MDAAQISLLHHLAQMLKVALVILMSMDAVQMVKLLPGKLEGEMVRAFLVISMSMDAVQMAKQLPGKLGGGCPCYSEYGCCLDGEPIAI